MAVSSVSSMSAIRDERGVALVTILLIVTVLTAVVARLSLSNEVWVRQVQGDGALAQADQVSRAAQHWVGMLLERDTNELDGHTDLWARPIPPIPVDWGELNGRVQDLQGRFNLNNLVTAEGEVDPAALEQFRRLLRILELDPGIADAAVDWIDPDQTPYGGGGAEDGMYQGLQPPYLAANRPFGEAEEIRLLRGVDGEAWRALEPHITALPEATGVNVNTASPEVLAAVVEAWGSPRTALGEGQRWAGKTSEEPFADPDTFAAQAIGDAPGGETPPNLTVQTNYFLVRTEARFGSVSRSLATVYRRSGGEARIIRHSTEIR
ncbi:MAG: type II secretion system minor pseudopilin GspK [Thiohalorhabdus sp.]|uniref:type II secretion system minor pseudopilin GspK n=1 Tax=Thiohalorhabdus sp. TaxID=3094134 RepID=UPI00397F417D